jgi:uncharacterized Zn-binding protein involved in type VI secretion
MAIVGSGISRLGDFESGHGCWFPVPITSAIGTVLVNKLPAAKVGDVTAPHVCPKKSPHIDQIALGSLTIYVNKRGVARIGDILVSLGPGGIAVMASGSHSVLAGG